VPSNAYPGLFVDGAPELTAEGGLSYFLILFKPFSGQHNMALGDCAVCSCFLRLLVCVSEREHRDSGAQPLCLLGCLICTVASPPDHPRPRPPVPPGITTDNNEFVPLKHMVSIQFDTPHWKPSTAGWLPSGGGTHFLEKSVRYLHPRVRVSHQVLEEVGTPTCGPTGGRRGLPAGVKVFECQLRLGMG
jgi:hypothetical protein